MAKAAPLATSSAPYLWALNHLGDVVLASALCTEDRVAWLGRSWADEWPESCRSSLLRAFESAKTSGFGATRIHAALPGRAKRYFEVNFDALAQAMSEGLISARVYDITDTASASAFLASTIEQLPLGLVVTDASTGEVVLMNRAADSLASDFQVSQNAESNIFDYPIDLTNVFAGKSDLLSLKDDTGTERRLALRRLVTFDDDGPRHVIRLVEDVTIRERNAEQLKGAIQRASIAEAAKAAFFAQVTHELRTPMNGLLVALDLLLDRPTDDTSELVAIANRSARSLQVQLEEMMAIAGGRSEFEQEPSSTSISEVATAFVDRLRAKAALGNCRIRICFPERDQTLPKGTPNETATLLDQLAEYTLKTWIGAEEIVITAQVDTGQGPSLSIGVSGELSSHNQPNAIEQAILEHASGIGVTLTRNASGVTVTFGLPVRAHEYEVARRPRILVADDHPTNRRIVEMTLATLAEVSCVCDGRAALDAAIQDSFDAILMDIQMPEMDGIAAVTEIRRHEASNGLSQTPIIMLTANSEDSYRYASLEAGANGFLGKPFSPSSLISEISRLLA